MRLCLSGRLLFPAELELIDRQTEQRNDQTDEGGTGVLQQGIQTQADHDEDDEKYREGIEPDLVGTVHIGVLLTQDDHRSKGQGLEDHAAEYYQRSDLVQIVGEDQQAGNDHRSDDGAGGGVVLGVELGEGGEEHSVLGHCVVGAGIPLPNR